MKTHNTSNNYDKIILCNNSSNIEEMESFAKNIRNTGNYYIQVQYDETNMLIM